MLVMLFAASYSRRWTARLWPAPGDERILIAASHGGSPPPAEGGNSTGLTSKASLRGLHWPTLAEVAIGVAVLLLTTRLTGTQTGRAAVETAAAVTRVPGRPDVSLTLIPYDTGTNTLVGRGKVQVGLSPSRTGRNVVEALVYSADDSSVTIPELRLTSRDADRGIGSLDAGLVDEHGYWGSNVLDLPVAGTWTLKATVRVSGIAQVTVEKAARIRR
ncbi:hypothetical protein AB0F77_38930 [Streptomyces sp. NPDC026672]|uniref:hypothetical protein n=1 Tax=unclassified Streptomyces TaxID=2593676 RepID=UPI0034091820